MITLTAEIEIGWSNINSFKLGESPLGGFLFGETSDDYIINKSNILSCETEIRDRADIDKPSFGLISSGGSISFNDRNKVFLQLYEDGVFGSKNKVFFYIENTITKARQLVATHYIDNVDYDIENNVVNVQTTDGLERLQNIDSERVVFHETVDSGEILSFLLEKAPMIDVPSYDGYFVNFEYPEIDKGNVWSQLSKLYTSIASVGYIGEDGKLKMKALV